jgi:hypothetical protein
MNKMKNGKEKSNRAKADLFELLVAKGLANFYKTNDNFDQEIEEIKNKILKSFDGDETQIKQQLERFDKTEGVLEGWLVGEKILEVKKVIWVGRDKESISDVELILSNGSIKGISIKSVCHGTGTEKNIGLATLKKSLGIDIDDMLEEMWIKVKSSIKEKNIIDNIDALSHEQIKDLKYEHPEIQIIGKSYGLIVQETAVRQSMENFNKLNDESKSLFLKYIFGIEGNKKILKAIYDDNGVNIFWNDIYNNYFDGRYLQMVPCRGKSYMIAYKGKNILRVQSCFTNGVGLSPFCQRAFLME